MSPKQNYELTNHGPLDLDPRLWPLFLDVDLHQRGSTRRPLDRGGVSGGFRVDLAAAAAMFTLSFTLCFDDESRTPGTPPPPKADSNQLGDVFMTSTSASAMRLLRRHEVPTYGDVSLDDVTEVGRTSPPAVRRRRRRHHHHHQPRQPRHSPPP